MKKLLLFSILFFLSIFSIVAQSPCPTVSITAPNTPTKIGDSMTFTAKVDGISLENLKYKWVVSNSVILSGQGTLNISVATAKEMNGQTITSTIEVSGLPQNCPNEFSGSGDIEALPLPTPHRNYDYGKISWQEEKIWLDSIAKKLIEEKDLRVVLRISLTVKNNSQPFKMKSVKIKKYLTTKHKISKNRIIIESSGNEENLTTIWFIPAGVILPSQ